jgi:DNA replication and repair protein RecF
LIGPHRDDFEIIFDAHDVSNFGSRGEQRSCVLALKISEIDFIEKEKSDTPVLLLDDIFSELDEKHQEAVLETIKGKQTIITSTEIPKFLSSKKLKVINLQN